MRTVSVSRWIHQRQRVQATYRQKMQSPIPRPDHLQVIPTKYLIPHRKLGKAEKSRTAEWREKTGKTKKANAANMQLSVASIFNRVINPRKRALAQRKESEEPDSDIEIIEPEPQADIAAPGETLQAEAVVNVSTPLLDGVGSNTDSPMPDVAARLPLPQSERSLTISSNAMLLNVLKVTLNEVILWPWMPEICTWSGMIPNGLDEPPPPPDDAHSHSILNLFRVLRYCPLARHR
ncbi:hypothetical protein B0H14DRAFT_2563274 [Mycena olivaceomarginata]|nr:hypothetical protein B0H14DRAFT_2563274 [Mycena olivaceomarginata]